MLIKILKLESVYSFYNDNNFFEKMKNSKYTKFIKLNFLIEKEIVLMNSKKSNYNVNRFKYWFYKFSVIISFIICF